MRFFYLCNWTGHSGGIKVLYDHVHLLNELGAEAYLASYGPFERCTWFDNSEKTVPAISGLLEEVTPEDLVVLPEFCMWDEELKDCPCRQIVFVQNPDLITGSLHRPRYENVMVPSSPLIPWIREKTDYNGPFLSILGFLESELICAPRIPKKDNARFLIVERPDKHNGEPMRVCDALRREGLDITYVDKMIPRVEFVELFKQHDVYLHLSYNEGFPVSIMEAFGAGCMVIGFAGRGGLEFMVHGENCLIAAEGDWESVVQTVLNIPSMDQETWDRMVRNGRKTTVAYPRSRTKQQMAEVYTQLAGGFERAFPHAGR